jgi:hypothetical protein
LLKALARIAVRRGCGRMEWAVLDWNRPAIGFYRRLGATLRKEWILTRLTERRSPVSRADARVLCRRRDLVGPGRSGFERGSRAQDRRFLTSSSHDLETDRKAFAREPARHRDRRQTGERDAVVRKNHCV